MDIQQHIRTGKHSGKTYLDQFQSPKKPQILVQEAWGDKKII